MLLVQVDCNGSGPGNGEPPIDPTDVTITYNVDTELLEATVVHNGVAYTESNWPSEFGPPTFWWYQIDPRSTRIADEQYQVNYSTIRRQLGGFISMDIRTH